MIYFLILLAILVWVAIKRPQGVNIWFVKMLIQLIVGGGGIVFFLSDVQDWYKHDYGLLHTLLYIIFWIVAFLASAFWRMADMSADEIRDDAHHAMKMAKKCRYCLKKLPSYYTAKCPHCTADL
jgi:glucan phosphoethanolaminetransferase (alkaline phosphatase superfamily)